MIDLFFYGIRRSPKEGNSSSISP